MKRLQYVFLLLLASLLACQKPIDQVKPADPTKPTDTTITTPTPHKGVVYGRGTSVGQPIQKVIGPEGGTMASADSTLQMIIPAGAVAKATTFTMQPVTGTLPGLLGGQSFRLLPEGQTFAQPVTLQYHYKADGLDGTSTQALFMAYQNADGVWKALLNTELNETAQTLTVTTKHFSDWGAFAEYTLEATPDVVFPGQTSELKLEGYWGDIAPLASDQLEVELTQQQVLEDPGNIKNWQLIGKGALSVGASRTKATYSAPDNAGQGSVTVTVDVYNILPPTHQPRKGAGGKAVLLKSIRIEGTYFLVMVNGTAYDSKSYQGTVDPAGAVISGITDNGSVINLSLHTGTLRTGTFSYSLPEELGQLDGKADASVVSGGINYVSYHYNCNEEVLPSAGSVIIDAIEEFHGQRYARGSFTVTGYWIIGDCPNLKVETRKVSGQFRVLVTQLI